MRRRRRLALAAAVFVLAADLGGLGGGPLGLLPSRVRCGCSPRALPAPSRCSSSRRASRRSRSRSERVRRPVVALGTFVAALVWSRGVPDPLVRGSVAFNLADLAIAVGDALLLASALYVAWRRRHQLRQPV